MKILIIDNNDSYIHNMAQFVEKTSKIKPDIINRKEIDRKIREYTHIIIGSGSKNDPEIYLALDKVLDYGKGKILTIGTAALALYHQNGGELKRGKTGIQGLAFDIYSENKSIFKNTKNIKATIYSAHYPMEMNLENIEILAKDKDENILAFKDKNKNIGLVFHPESENSKNTEKIFENFFKKPREIKYEILDNELSSIEIFDTLDENYTNLQWLDSSQIVEEYSRFSIFGLSSKEKGHLIKYYGKEEKIEIIYEDKVGFKNQNIYDFFKSRKKRENLNLPFDFQLGYIGYLGYEAQNIIKIKRDNKTTPDGIFQYIDRAIIKDHIENKLYILSFDEYWIEEVKEILKNPVQKEVIKGQGDIKAYFNLEKEEYINRIKYIIEMIKAGEIRQICMTNILNLEGNIVPEEYYKILREKSPAPYSALIRFEDLSISSSSMERFITVDSFGNAESKPIKGTAKRGKNKEEDKEIIKALANDEKTFAENMIILDLLKNDFLKICEYDTVKVTKLMEVESYETLHQLVSTVKGKLKKDYQSIELLEIASPGGSMTGSPKKRAVELLEELENWARGPYSGSIGFVSDNGAIDFNIIIRSLVQRKNSNTIGLGGAITGLSDPEEEFEEILLKAKGILEALGEYFDIPISNFEIEK